MALEVVKFSYLSEFVNLPVLRISDNKRIGKLVDLAATTMQVYPRVTGLMVRTNRGKPPIYIPWSNVKRMVFKEHIAVEYPAIGEQQAKAAENEILVCKTFLDKQIISTEGYKIVRVNDLQLLIEDKAKEKYKPMGCAHRHWFQGNFAPNRNFTSGQRRVSLGNRSRYQR